MYRPSIDIVFIVCHTLVFFFLLVRNHYSKSATAFGRKCQTFWGIAQGLLFGQFCQYMQHPSGMQKNFVRPGKLCFEIKCTRSRNMPTALEESRIMYPPSLRLIFLTFGMFACYSHRSARLCYISNGSLCQSEQKHFFHLQTVYYSTLSDPFWKVLV